MAVFRVERTQNYTIMSNYHLRADGLPHSSVMAFTAA